MLQGCLSDIPPGYSTSINESLHQKINQLFAGAKMGPELAFALLTVFFYAWNSRRKSKINGLPIVEPLLSVMNCENIVKSTPKEPFGIGNIFEPIGNTGMSSREDEANIEQSNQSNAIFKRAMSMLRLRNSLNTMSNNGSGVNWHGLFFHNEILRYIFKETLGNQIRQEEENGNEAIKTRLEGLAGRFGMQIVPMSRDGNCLFASVGFSIMQRLSSTLSTVRQQYVNLGIQSTSTLECNSQTLR